MRYDKPIRAILSDAYTSIHASFASTAVREYEQSYRNRLTQGTVCGLLNLVDYEIVVTALGPLHEHITLFVKTFTWVGGTSGGTFGRPLIIQDRHGISDILHKLVGLPPHEAFRGHAKVDEVDKTDLGVASQLSQVPNNVPTTQHQGAFQDTSASQMEMATQIPLKQPTAPPMKHKVAQGVNLSNPIGASSGRSFTPESSVPRVDHKSGAVALLKLLPVQTGQSDSRTSGMPCSPERKEQHISRHSSLEGRRHDPKGDPQAKQVIGQGVAQTSTRSDTDAFRAKRPDTQRVEPRLDTTVRTVESLSGKAAQEGLEQQEVTRKSTPETERVVTEHGAVSKCEQNPTAEAPAATVHPWSVRQRDNLFSSC